MGTQIIVVFVLLPVNDEALCLYESVSSFVVFEKRLNVCVK